eukprot:g29775.t1
MNLPEIFEIVASFLIFSDLTAAKATAKSWNKAATLCAGKLKVNLDFSSRKDAAPTLYRFTERASYYTTQVNYISFEFCKHLPPDAMSAMSAFPNLTVLNLNGCHRLTSSPAGLERVARCCSAKLRALHLYWNPELESKGLQYIARSRFAPNLITLNLSGTRLLTDKAVRTLARRCGSLQHLDLTRAEKITGAALSAVSEHCPGLKSLVTYACANITDDGVRDVGLRCPGLEKVDFCGARLLSDNAVSLLLSHCTRLQSVSLQWCIRISDASLVQAKLPQLRHFSVHGLQRVTDAGLAALAQTSCRLESLDINGCTSVQERQLSSLQLNALLQVNTVNFQVPHYYGHARILTRPVARIPGLNVAPQEQYIHGETDPEMKLSIDNIYQFTTIICE